MAFVSCEFVRLVKFTHAYTYTLVDSDFGAIKTTISYAKAVCASGNIVVQEYGNRGLNLGKNLALAAIWCNKQYGWSIRGSIERQNIHLNYLRNWDTYAKERDEHLEKLLVLA